MNTGTLFKMPLDDTETYEDFAAYLSNVIPDANKEWFQFTLKDATSIMSPVILVNIDFMHVAQYNYVRILFNSSGDEFQTRYYYIEDIVSVRSNLCEIHLKMDVFRTIDWINNGTRVKLMYTTNSADWSTTCDDPRWKPYKPYKNNGTVVDEFQTGLPYGQGIYAVKWWNGHANDGNPLGITCGLFDQKNFNSFVYQVTNYLADNPGVVLHGFTDFTDFIISAKFIPGLSLSDCARMGDFVHQNLVVVGGFAVITCSCYMKRDKFGAINSWLDGNIDPEDHYIPVSPLGTRQLSQASLRKLKFLMTPKWCQMTIKTPVGVGSIDTSSFTNGDKLYYSSILDLESGTLTMNFFRNSVDEDHIDLKKSVDMDLLLSLSGAVFYDVKDHFVHVQDMDQVVTKSLGSGAISAMGSTAMTGNYVVGAVSGVATAVGSLLSEREINQPKASNGNNLFWLHLNEESLTKCYYQTKIFLNEDTPLGGGDKSTYILWDADDVYSSYHTWCTQPYHGFPSIKYTDLSYTAGMAAGTTWLRCAEVFSIGHGSGIIPTPEMEDEIRNRLLNGVYIHANRI